MENLENQVILPVDPVEQLENPVSNAPVVHVVPTSPIAPVTEAPLQFSSLEPVIETCVDTEHTDEQLAIEPLPKSPVNQNRRRGRSKGLAPLLLVSMPIVTTPSPRLVINLSDYASVSKQCFFALVPVG